MSGRVLAGANLAVLRGFVTELQTCCAKVGSFFIDYGDRLNGSGRDAFGGEAAGAPIRSIASWGVFFSYSHWRKPSGDLSMKATIWLALVAICLTAAPWSVNALAQPPATGSKPAAARPVVQIAVLLDTSNSMDGLIEQAKSQLWRIVNEFTVCKRNGMRPDVQVALYQYGTPSLGADNGFVRQIQPLTLDLDKISEELFKLNTDGGDEYCGSVISHAVKNLTWSANKADFKVIFIAGNEPFNQGQVDFRAAVKEAVDKGVVVNTIFCGDATEGINTHWKDGAVLGGGSYMSINTDSKAVHIDAPQDKRLLELSGNINKTYLFFGADRARFAENQAVQDGNAGKAAPGAAVQRAVTKGSQAYNYAEHDLVDAWKEGKIKLEEVKKEDLPEDLKKLEGEELKKAVEAKQKEREAIQKEIAELRKARDEYVTKKMKEMATEAGKDTLENAVIGAIRKQAQDAGFEFDKT